MQATLENLNCHEFQIHPNNNQNHNSNNPRKSYEFWHEVKKSIQTKEFKPFNKYLEYKHNKKK
jgi:hypothetical protein